MEGPTGLHSHAATPCCQVNARAPKSDTEISKDEKRQILADILVWAEVTQPHYSSSTQSFVTEHHDESFQRIGDSLRAAKAQRGLL